VTETIAPYHHLSNLGKLRRLRDLASLGLTHYDIKNPSVTYHGFETNLFYRVTAETGERFMLRLASPRWRTLEDLQSEAMWLNAINHETTIPVPSVMPTRSGENILSLSVPEVPDIWHMTLMRWIPGRLLGHYLNINNLEKMGRLFADLHHFSANWVPPAEFSKRRFEHWLSRGEEDLLTDLIETDKRTPNARLPKVQIQVLERIMLHVESAYQTIDPADLRVIHCDLWHDNIKLYKGNLLPFDFEDTIWGYRAHDIAMAMLDLVETVGEERYPGLLSAFKQGYHSLMTWPEDPIEPFQIGRLLWVINWVARFDPNHLEGMINRYTPVFENYERTGLVTLP